LDDEGQEEAERDETEDVAAGGIWIGLYAFGERPLPEEREDEPRECQGKDVGKSFAADEKFWRDGRGGCVAINYGSMGETENEELSEEEKESRDGKEDERVA
jgi:hypothetical protein